MGIIQAMTEKKWDLVVVGGGLTGVAAAVSARRQGLDVLLIEKAGFLGGAPGTLLINPFMPYSTTVDGKRFELSRGFFSELRALLKEVGGYRDGREDIHEEYLKLALDRLVMKEGVQPLFHAVLCGVEKDGETITAVKVVTKVACSHSAAAISSIRPATPTWPSRRAAPITWAVRMGCASP